MGAGEGGRAGGGGGGGGGGGAGGGGKVRRGMCEHVCVWVCTSE